MSDGSGNWPSLSTVFLTITAATITVAAVAAVVATGGAAAALVASIGGSFASTASVAATASVVATQAAAVAACTTAASVVSHKVEKATTQTYSVYFLEDESGRIQYVGRVTDSGYNDRMAYHKATRGLTPAHRVSGLSYAEARGLEEIGMIECHTLNASNPVNNQIHGISARNKNGAHYLEAAGNYLFNRAENRLLTLVM